jgi:hypothetical protein
MRVWKRTAADGGATKARNCMQRQDAEIEEGFLAPKTPLGMTAS